MWINLCQLYSHGQKNGCKNASVGCIYGSNYLYDCIIGRCFYTLTNICTSRCISAGCKNAMYPYSSNERISDIVIVCDFTDV